MRASRSVVFSGYGVSLLLGTGSGVISFGSCFLVDRNCFVVVVDGPWIWPETLVNDWFTKSEVNPGKDENLPELTTNCQLFLWFRLTTLFEIGRDGRKR